MPSGSHSSSGGSHFSGGSSGGSHFGGGGSSRSSGGNNTTFIWFGGGRRGGNGSSSNSAGVGFIVAFILFFVLAMCFVGIGSFNQDIKVIEQDYARYQSMIKYAESNDEYMIVGTVLSVHYNADAKKYYVKYSFTNPETSKTYNGETFSVYDSYLVYSVNDPITLAIDCKKSLINENTDSIPVEYKNSKLTDDGEYVGLKQDKKMVIIMVVVICGLIVLTIVFSIKNQIKQKKLKEIAVDSDTSSQTKVSEKRCAYCGSLLKENENTCSKCGASYSKDR